MAALSHMNYHGCTYPRFERTKSVGNADLNLKFVDNSQSSDPHFNGQKVGLQDEFSKHKIGKTEKTNGGIIFFIEGLSTVQKMYNKAF